MIPFTRREVYLSIMGGESYQIPEPRTREEVYLAAAAGMEITKPEPKTRYEMLLDNLSGGSYEITPVTRLEMLIAKAAGAEVPEFEPKTREEILWSKIDLGGTPTTVFGISPLTLLNAIKTKLKHLTQYGKCSVSGSTITCNNGVLSASGDEIITTGTAEVITVSASGADDQTASAVNLYEVDGLTDEQDIITGKVTRRTQAVVSDGTTPSGRYIGDATAGNVIVKALETVYKDVVVSFDSDEEVPLNLLKAEFSPVQDLHGQDAPYPAGGGKNKFNKDDFTALNGVYVDGSTLQIKSGGANKGFILPCVGGETYTLSCKVKNPTDMQIASFIGVPTIGDIATARGGIGTTATVLNVSITTGASDTYLFVKYNSTSATQTYTETEILAGVQIELGSTATAYAPYSNICPIDGWDGVDIHHNDKTIPVQFRTDTVNQWDEEWELGGIDTTTGQNIASNNTLRSTNFIPVTGGETYRVVIGGSTTLWLAVLTYDAEKNFIANAGGKVGGSTFTVDSSVAYIRFYVTSNYGTNYNHDISINYPATETSYVPYLTTVYGGYIRINRDGSVDLVGTQADVDLGTLTWTYDASKERFRGTLPATSSASVSNPSAKTHCLCSIYKTSAEAYADSNRTFMVVCVNTDYAWLRDNRFTDADTYKTAMSGVQFAYELAEPIIYHLPSIEALKSYIGTNNIWSSTNEDTTVAVAQDEVIEQVTAQPLTLAEGTNTISWTAEVAGKQMSVEYKASE